MNNKEYYKLLDCIARHWSSILSSTKSGIDASIKLTAYIDGIQTVGYVLNLDSEQRDELLFLWSLALKLCTVKDWSKK